MLGMIWAGTDDGLIHLTTNGGKELDQRDAADSSSVLGQGLADRGVPLRP
jgi:hypothetical protein